MSSGVTEIANLPLKAGSNIHDPNTPEGTIFQDTLQTVLGVDGAQRAYWGTEIENASMLRLFVDWDSSDAHKTFIKSREYGPFLKNLGAIMDGAPSLYHVGFKPHPATAALSDTNAPVTEVLTLYFESSVDTSKVEADLKKFVSAVEESVKDNSLKGSAGGWAEEEVENAKAGGKAKVYVAVIGWESVEAHNNAKKGFESSMPILKELPGLKDIQMVHVKFTEQTGGPNGGIGIEEQGGSANNIAQDEILNPHEQHPAPPKTRSDGTTVKHNDDLKGAANEVHKERAGRGPYHHSVNHGN